MGVGRGQSICYLISNSRADTNFFWERWKEQGRPLGAKKSRKKGTKRKEGKGKRKGGTESRASSFPKVVAAPEGTQRAKCPRGWHGPARGRPLFLPGPAGSRGPGRAGSLSSRGFAQPERRQPATAAAGPACVCLRAAGVACGGWEWRSPRRGRGPRVRARSWRAGGGARAASGSLASAAPLPEGSRPSAPAPAALSFRRSRRAPRRVSKGPGAPAERLCGPRAAWHLADAPLAAGAVAAAGPAVWEPRGPAPSRPSSSLRAVPPPPARAARPQSRPPAAPGAGPAAEPGPPARPVRDGAPGRLSRRSARPSRGGRSRRRAAALEWRDPAAAIPAATGLGTVPTRTPGPLAPLRPALARARPPGIPSASCASASASSTRSWAPRGTTWAPCASCNR